MKNYGFHSADIIDGYELHEQDQFKDHSNNIKKNIDEKMMKAVGYAKRQEPTKAIGDLHIKNQSKSFETERK